MADGSRDNRSDPKQLNNFTFFAPDPGRDHTKKCSEETSNHDKVKLSFYTELDASETWEKMDTRGGVVSDRSPVKDSSNAPTQKSSETLGEDGEDRKKRCFDRYDSSESSDSGVAVLSPTESSSVCSGSSDITEPRSPPSPESSCEVPEEGAEARMPPWACDPEPAAPRRIAPPPAPTRRPAHPIHRRITEFFNHKMKPHNGLKREANASNNEASKKKCLPKNGVTHDLEKYISFLSQTLSPRVLMDVGKQADNAARKNSNYNKIIDNKGTEFGKGFINSNVNGLIDYNKPKDNKEKAHTTSNGFKEVSKQKPESSNKNKSTSATLNGFVGDKRHALDVKMTSINPSANGKVCKTSKNNDLPVKRKMPVAANNDLVGLRVAQVQKPDSTKLFSNDVTSTTKLDSKMNGVTCGSNNISLNPIVPKLAPAKRESQKKTAQPAKRTNRKSSACIANSKNLTWSKANNLKQVHLQKQNCSNPLQSSPVHNMPSEPNMTPKINIPNGVRQIPMTLNGNLSNLNQVPATNFQNCQQVNYQQQCNNPVTSTNLASFVAVPHNVMLTTLRIPQNGIPAQSVNQHNNIGTFARQNVNVSSPKLNGQFVFPFVQNINGTVVQIPNIPNIMTKVSNFVLPQTSQMGSQRQDHQAAQILINGTLLKLANTMTSAYPNVNKTIPPTSQSMPVENKNIPGMPSVGMTVQQKQNYTVNLSHSMIVSQPGFIVTSVPNINVKETWSSPTTQTVSSTQNSTCSNPIVQHPPPVVNNFTSQPLHTSSIPIAPVKPPDHPIQGTEPPSSTVKEPETSCENTIKCDIPWLSKTLNNNLPLDSKNIVRPFAQVCKSSEKFSEFIPSNLTEEKTAIKQEKDKLWMEKTNEEIKRLEEVARREETIFTQITVLKDVSSSVTSSVIESNYSGATTESSESGIGTDKSIDSPSDSQTSKECDDDSSLSLSVSVCSSMDVPSSQKSPLLKQPKILRFPPMSIVKADKDKRKSSTDTSSTVTVCLWEDCKLEFESDTDLLEHLQVVHVETQAGREHYTCQWQQCKVKGKPSCSRLWLERHTLSHGGNKPFKCIVDDCDKRFSTQILLERHVNNHFNEQSPNAGSGKKSTDSAPKLIRRNGKKLRYRRQPWSARMFDFFDAGTMEGLAWRLGRCTRWRLGGSPLREPAGRHTLTLHAALTATRYNAAKGKREALVTYYPPNVLEDEWVPESEVKRIRRVEISELPTHTKVLLYEQFCSSYRKPPSPPPLTPPATVASPAPLKSRTMPLRNCTSSRLLNNLIAKQKKIESKECPASNPPIVIHKEEEKSKEVTGAKKRKLGRRHGGNAFWPCGR